MRLKIIAVFFFITLLSSFAFAQDGGGKPLPGEGTPTATIPATVTPLTADEPTATATTPAEEPTENGTVIETESEFPAEMLADAGIEAEENELVLQETFDEEDAWEIGDYDTGALFIDDGQYFVTAQEAGFFLWGQNEDMHSDVVIQVTTEQLSSEDDNSYGLICRASPENNADGYHFRISGEGSAFIFLYRNGRQREIVEESNIDAINQGRAINTITAVCIDTYLALFVNGEFVLEYTDDTYSEGVTGLATGNLVEDSTTEISFDDVYIWELDDATVPQLEDPNPTEDTVEDSDLDADAAAEELTDALEQGDIEIDLGDLLLSDGFSDDGDWISYSGDMLREVNNGAYRFEGFGENFFFWAQNDGEEEYEDVVIRVDAELSSGDDTEYGLMCRSDVDANGYNFLLSSTGEYIISYWDGDEYEVLVQDDSDAINTDEDQNTIYVVCVGEYFALYANGELLDEIEDDTYDEGISSLVVMPRNDDDVTVEFDNIFVWEASD
jgi:hypothetical protein